MYVLYSYWYKYVHKHGNMYKVQSVPTSPAGARGRGGVKRHRNHAKKNRKHLKQNSNFPPRFQTKDIKLSIK